MRDKLPAITFCILGVLVASNVSAKETTPTIKIRVEDRAERGEDIPEIPVEKKGKKPKTETTVKEEEIRRGAGAGGVNVFRAIELTPSVNVQTDDAYGLGGGSIRLRGFDDRQIGVTIDGMPLNDSGNYALYPHEYADVENLEAITIERGAVSKKNPFYVEIGGAVRIITKPPKDKFEITLFPKIGTEDFRKIFLRADTGKLPLGLKAFASYSHTEADKWKGPGKHPAFRDHYTVGIQQNLGRVFWEFYYDLNVQLNHFYRALTYAQAKDLENFRRFDYTASLLFPGGNGTAHNNATIRDNNLNYYDFWKNPYTNHQLRGNFEFNLTPKLKLSLKPYMWIGRGCGSSTTSFTSGNNTFISYREAYNYTDRPGYMIELIYQALSGEFLVGFWYERADLKQWRYSLPVQVHPDGSYTLITRHNGTAPTFRYDYIQRTITTTRTPYVFYELTDIMGRLDLTLGLRFANTKRDFRAYSFNGSRTFSSAVSNVPFYPKDGVFDDPRIGINPALSYKKTYSKVLPSVGIGVKLTECLNGYFAYARNFRVPPNFLGTVSNVTAQFVVDQLKPEEADNFDIGLRYEGKNYYISPALYYVNYKNRLVRTTDPTDPNLVYLRNAGKVKGYGFELEAGYVVNRSLRIYSSYSYNVAEFRDDCIRVDATGNPQVCGLRGNQVPDTPKHMFKLGLHAKLYDFNIKPSLQVIGSRYGTFDNLEKISSYALVNLSIDRKLTKNFHLYIDVINLTDKKYIGRISPAERAGSASYRVGAPFTLSTGIQGRF